MNFLRKYYIFVLCSAIAVVLLIAAGLKLASSAKHFSEEKSGLQAATARLQQLHSRDPYPSSENVRRESENVDNLLQAYSALNEMLRDGQVDPEEMEAADFMPLLENTLRRLRNQLERARIIFSDDFPFGFEKYAGGQLPAPRDIPRLVQQLKIIEKLCEVFPEANITELVSISRDVFETGETLPTSGVRLRRRGEAAQEPEPEKESEAEKLYTTQAFKMVFRAKEHAVFDVLNRLARHPMFTVVAYADMASKDQDIKARAVPMPAPQQKTGLDVYALEPESRDRRVILGKEDIEVRLEVEVYQFAPSMAFQ